MGVLRFISRWLELYSVVRGAFERGSAVNGIVVSGTPTWTAQSSYQRTSAMFFSVPSSSDHTWEGQHFDHDASEPPAAQQVGNQGSPLTPAWTVIEARSEERLSYEMPDSQDWGYDASSAQRECEGQINSALTAFEDMRDGDLEEFLPQLASLFLGCAEPDPDRSNRQRFLWATVSSPLHPLAVQIFANMRAKLGAVIFQRCTSNPALAVKLSWLLEDVRQFTNVSS